MIWLPLNADVFLPVARGSGRRIERGVCAVPSIMEVSAIERDQRLAR